MRKPSNYGGLIGSTPEPDIGELAPGDLYAETDAWEHGAVLAYLEARNLHLVAVGGNLYAVAERPTPTTKGPTT